MIINAVDLQLRAAKVTSISAYVTWRFFDAQEKPYIDGVQLRFRKSLFNDLTSNLIEYAL